LKVKMLRISDLWVTGDLMIAVDVIVGSPVLDAPGAAEGSVVVMEPPCVLSSHSK
jgi:hypothetical protein